MAIKVFKFGGASVKDAEHIRQFESIIDRFDTDTLVVVISAMDKTTNLLEDVFREFFNSDKDLNQLMVPIIDLHLAAAKNLDLDSDRIKAFYERLIQEAVSGFDSESLRNRDLVYDQIVSLGELFSTHLIFEFLATTRQDCAWYDIRDVIVTDRRYREGKVSFAETQKKINDHLLPVIQQNRIIITQGFIGRNNDNKTVTLGREGSDYTAALLSYFLDVKELSIWKDVPGILTADPKRFDNVEKIDRMSYREAIEMTYYGAKVIHPKTIQPIQNKSIRLNVNSFKNPEVTGTVISAQGLMNYPPIVVVEDDVVLIQISSLDYSFIQEDHLSTIFGLMDVHKIKLLTMRNSAISFTISIKHPSGNRLEEFTTALQDDFSVEMYTGLQLLTIRHYNNALVEFLTQDKVVLFEETHKDTVQLVVRGATMLKPKS